MKTVLQNSFWLDSVDSTNEEVKRLIDSGKITQTSYVVANEQTRGKGTHGRTWISPKGAGVYLSVVHFPKAFDYLELARLCTLSSGIAACETLNKLTGIKVQLKPLNDILVDNKKLGGILVETRLGQNKVSALITGVGINTYIARREITDLKLTPVALQEIVSKEIFDKISIKKLTEHLVKEICFWHELVFKNEISMIENRWASYVSKSSS